MGVLPGWQNEFLTQLRDVVRARRQDIARVDDSVGSPRQVIQVARSRSPVRPAQQAGREMDVGDNVPRRVFRHLRPGIEMVQNLEETTQEPNPPQQPRPLGVRCMVSRYTRLNEEGCSTKCLWACGTCLWQALGPNCEGDD